MGEILDYLKERFGKKNSDSEQQMLRVSIKNTIVEMCEEYLASTEDVLTFEVMPKELEYMAIIIDEEPLRSRYVINQIDRTLFQASLKEVDI